MNELRVGEGWDIHALVAGRPLVLGGISVPHTHGLDGHSDADALLHAITDALLGAAGLGDIGRHFPDSNPQYRGADSRELLRAVLTLLQARKLRVVNADLTLVAEAPRVAAYIGTMQLVLAQDIAISADAINIKATTTEGMGWIGRGEGIAAHAVVLLTSP